MENQIPAFAHYGIKCEFNHVFQYLVCGAEAVTGLLSLKQGPVTVADVSIQFHILAANNGWNDIALWEVYIKWS